MFAPLNYIKKLQAVGISEAQAHVHAETLSEIIDKMTNTLASKEDLKRLEERIDARIDKIDGKIIILDNRINHVEMTLTAKINTVDSKLNYLISLVSIISVVLTGLNIFHLFF